MNYDIKPSWDTSLAIAFTLGTIAPSGVLNGLVYYAVKTTAGAPTAIAGRYIAGAKVANAATGLEYQNTGTTASPVFTVNTAAAINQLTGDVTAGPGTGSVAATLAEAVRVVTTKVTILAADVATLNSVPVALIPAPGAGKAIQVLGVFGRMTFAAAAYATNTDVLIRPVGATTYMAHNTNLLLTTAGVAIQEFALGDNSVTDNNALVANAALEASIGTGDPTGGGGDLDLYITYTIVTL